MRVKRGWRLGGRHRSRSLLLPRRHGARDVSRVLVLASSSRRRSISRTSAPTRSSISRLAGSQRPPIYDITNHMKSRGPRRRPRTTFISAGLSIGPAEVKRLI